MGVDCGSQAVLCEYPVRLDTYSGCSHGCKYCFARTKVDIEKVTMKNCAKQLRSFIEGKRNGVTKWCDWAIPLHWGGLSDPFQPIERRGGASLECLKVFAETKYPVIISTKGKLITDEPYLSILRECNAVVQVSMVCSSYDRMEPGAPSFDERLSMVARLAGNCRRVIVRAQPYITGVKREFLSNVPRFAEAGAHGVTVEGMKFKKGKPGLVKVRGDYCYPEDLLEAHYALIRDACHDAGLAFYCAENRLRPMGDSPACCGCGDLPGFRGNRFNAVSLLNGIDCAPTDRMKEVGTAMCFKAIHQSPGSSIELRKESFASQMAKETESYQRDTRYHTEEETLAFTRWLKSTGIKAREINELTGTQMATHYLCTTPGGQTAVPTAELFTRLRRSPKLRSVPDYILRIVYGGGSSDTARLVSLAESEWRLAVPAGGVLRYPSEPDARLHAAHQSRETDEESR